MAEYSLTKEEALAECVRKHEETLHFKAIAESLATENDALRRALRHLVELHDAPASTAEHWAWSEAREVLAL